MDSSSNILPVKVESDEVKLVFWSTNVLNSNETYEIDVIYEPGEGYFMNSDNVTAKVYVQGTEMLTESELSSSIVEGSTRTITYDATTTSSNTLTWSVTPDTGHGFSEQAFETLSTTLSTSSNQVYFHADGDPGVIEVIVSDNGQPLHSLMYTVFATGSDNKFLEPETRFNAYQSPADYELVSFPLDVTTYDAFQQIMEPLLGIMDPTNYLIYGFENTLESYLRIDDPNLDFDRGRAYWMARAAGGKVEFLGDGTAFSEQISLTLNTGWNMVGNPYGDRLDVRDIAIQQNNEAISLTSSQNNSTDPWIWVLKDQRDNDDYYEFGDILEPMQGGWIYVIEPSVTLVFSPRLFSDSIAAFKPRLSSGNVRQPPSPPTSSSSGSSGGGGGCLLKLQRGAQ